MSKDDAAAWREERRAAAAAHAEALAQRDARESARASALLEDFVARAQAHGLPPEPLVVSGYGGKGTARTQISGWYLRNDHTVGVGDDGEFYILVRPLTLLERLRGVHVVPSPPPLVIGKGSGDGDSIDLVDAIARVLPPDASA